MRTKAKIAQPLDCRRSRLQKLQKAGAFCDLQQFAFCGNYASVCKANKWLNVTSRPNKYMSKRRKQILPGAGSWDCFFDKGVQRALNRERWNSERDLTSEAYMEQLAWPIIAFTAADELTQEQPMKITRHVKFLQAYAQDPSFVASLLVKVTEYHLLKDEEKSPSRRIAEFCNLCKSDPWDGLSANEAELLNWQDISDQLELRGLRYSVSRLKTEFHREKKRRRDIAEKWSENFQAWEKLTTLRAGAKVSILPLMAISLRD